MPIHHSEWRCSSAAWHKRCKKKAAILLDFRQVVLCRGTAQNLSKLVPRQGRVTFAELDQGPHCDAGIETLWKRIAPLIPDEAASTPGHTSIDCRATVSSKLRNRARSSADISVNA